MRGDRHTIPVLLALSLAAAAAWAGSHAPGPGDRLQQALSGLARSDPRQADRTASAVAEQGGPAAGRAWLIAAEARRRLGSHDRAVEAYRRFLATCHSPGERQYVLSQMDRCAAEKNRAPRPQPASKRLTARQLAELAEVQGRHRQQIQTAEHFVVRAYNAELARLTALEAEAALERICQRLLHGQDYPHVVEVYVWPDIQEFRKHAATAPEWAGGSFRLTRLAGGQVARRIDLTQLDDKHRFDVNMLDRVLPHEICHLVLAELFGDAHCPLVLNEGLAMMAEAGLHNPQIRLAGAVLATDRKIPLEELLTIDRPGADLAAVFYAEAYSLVSYLHARLTPTQFRETLENLKAGCAFGEALQRALYLPHDEQFLARLSGAWQAEAVRQGQFLRALDTELSDAH